MCIAENLNIIDVYSIIFLFKKHENITNYPTNCMQQRSSCEADSLSASQEIPDI